MADPIEDGVLDPSELHDEDFQFALKALLAAYQPILEEQLKEANAPEALKDAAAGKPPNCEDELALANRIFENFLTEEVAVRLLPPEGRTQLGPVERWRWCLLHIRCCIIFGWLLCRGPRTFRAFAYYLYRYWICVRQALGTPVSTPLTAEQRDDFQKLVQALAGAYKPYLTDQLASVEFPDAIPDAIIDGTIDCFEGEEEAAAVFERLLTLDTAPALLGRAAFDAHSKDPSFFFCRCWCLCAIRFGCCLARARNFVEVLRCLAFFRRCLRQCFVPLHCQLTAPTGCTEEEANPSAGGLTVTVIGTAAGAFFGHYTLQWRKVEGRACDDDTDFQSTGVIYPGGAPTGASPVNAGILGFINTTVLPAGSYEVRVCVYSSNPGAPRTCCCIQFDLFKHLVWIDRVCINPGAPVQTPPGPFVSSAPVVNTNPGGIVVPVGGCVTVKGTAFVGDCANRQIQCIDLRWGIGFLPGPGEVGFNPAAFTGSLLVPTGPICYAPPDENLKRAQWNEVFERALTTRFVQTAVDLPSPPFPPNTSITVYKLQDFCFDSAGQLPPCVDLSHHCASGQFTLLLDVTDTLNNHYYDTQQVWFDNKPISAEIGGLSGLASCETMDLSKFVPPGGPCGISWPIDLQGIAFDELIDSNAPPLYPNDNFDFYSLSITRQGGPTYSVPITPDLVSFGPNPFQGNHRVGDPGKRCEQTIIGCPPPPFPPHFLGLLTRLDLRIFDATCVGSLSPPFVPPPGFALDRGQCCGYAMQLYVQDKTWSDGHAGGFHRILTAPWAVCICNDLPHHPPVG
jgi:hypothetical protein